MIYECENCGKEFEVAEPICPKCHSGDVIEYNDKIDELESRNKYLAKLNIKLLERLGKAIEYIQSNTHKVEWGDIESQDEESIDINDDTTETEFVEQLLKILEGEE